MNTFADAWGRVELKEPADFSLPSNRGGQFADVSRVRGPSSPSESSDKTMGCVPLPPQGIDQEL